MANTIYTKYVVEGDDETLQCLYDTFHAHAERIKPRFADINEYLELLDIEPDPESTYSGQWLCFGLDRSIGRPLLLFLEESRWKPTEVFEVLAQNPPLKGHITAIHTRSDDWDGDIHRLNDIDLRDTEAGDTREILDSDTLFRQFLHVWLGAERPELPVMP